MSETPSNLDQIPSPSRLQLEDWAKIPDRFREATEGSDWPESPLIELDVEGLGVVYIKSEAENPTGTVKDRLAFAVAKLYKRYAINALRDLDKGLEPASPPIFSVLSSGNEAYALAEMFRRFDLPAVKVLLDVNTPEQVIANLKASNAEVFTADLSAEKLEAEAILRLTGNDGGVELTSLESVLQDLKIYDSFFESLLQSKPESIYLPTDQPEICDLFLNFLFENTTKFRVNGMNFTFTGNSDSAFELNEVNVYRNIASSTTMINQVQIPDPQILEAQRILIEYGIDCEPSAAAGFAQWIDDVRSGRVTPDRDTQKCVVLVTGKGKVNEPKL